MNEVEARVAKFAEQDRPTLKQMLAKELGGAYPKPVPENLLNRFLRATFERISPGEDPIEKARTHEDFDSSWATKRRLATALRMVLSEYGVRKPETPLMRLDRATLAQLIVAIQLHDEGVTPAETEREAITPPDRPQPPESAFPNGLDLTTADEKQLREWVENEAPLNGAPYAVYVLDCTSPISDEWESVRALRAHVAMKRSEDTPLKKMEEAAAALNDGKRVYYVGFTNDVIDRVGRHLGGAAKGGGNFTHTFQPQSLVEINWFDYEAEARTAERQRANELTDGDSFGYWN